MRLLVTGTRGYLGGQIAHWATEKGWTVVSLAGRVAFADLERVFADAPFDAVVHAAFDVNFAPAERHDPASSSSVLNTKALLDHAAAASSPSHMVFLSAAGVFGVSETPQSRDELAIGQCHPDFAAFMDSRYIQDKLACEPLMAGYGGPATTLYLTTVYGPGMQTEVTQPLRKLSGPVPLVASPPGGTSFLGLADFLSALDVVLRDRVTGRFILSGGNVSYAHLLSTALRVLGVSHRKRVVTLPNRIARSAIAGPIGQRLFGAHDAAVALSAFGYKYYSVHRAFAAMPCWRPRQTLEQALIAALQERTDG